MASQAFEQKLKVVVEGVDAFSKSLKSMNDDMTGFINKMKQFVSQMNSISTNLNSAGNKIDEALTKAFFGNRKNKRGWGKDSIADFLNSEFKEIKKAITVTNVDATLEASTKKIKDLIKKADTSIANMKKALGSSSKKKSKSLSDSDTVKKLTDMFAETSWIYGINPDAVTKAWDATDSKYTSIIRNQLSKGKTKVANKFLSKVMTDAKKSANDALNLTNESKNDLRKTGVISRLMKSMIGGVDVEDPRAIQEFIDKMQKEPTDVLVKQLAKLNLNKVAKDAQGELKNARTKIDNALNDALFSSEKGSKYKNIAKGLMDQYKDQPFSTQMGNLKFLIEDINKAKKGLATDQKVMEKEVAELSKKKSAFFNKINNYNNSLADPKFKNDRANINAIANGVKANVFANTKAEMKAYDEALNAASKIVTDAKLRDKQEKLQEKINRELSKAYDKEKDKKSQTPSSNPYIPQLQSKLTDIASSVGLVVPSATLVDSLIGTISTGVENLTSLLSKLVMSITAVAAAFVGIGYAMKSFLTDVILSTEKMRGYNIGLLGMMKTQGAVNDLMAKSLNVTKDLPIAYDQIFASTKAFSMISPLRPMLTDSSKAEGNLERLYGIVMALSQIEPEWGIQGAIFSLREALSGDLLSLKRRFEIPVNMITTMDGQKLADVKNNPEMVIGALSDYFSKIYGKDALEATSRQFGSLMAKIQGYWEIFKNNIGEGGIYKVITDDLMKVRDSFGEFASSNGGKAFAKKISDVYITMYESLKNMATGIKGIMDSIFGTNIQGTDSIKLIVGFVEKYAQILRGIAAYLNSPEAKKAFGDLFDSMTAGAGKLYEELKNLVRNISWVLDNIVAAGTTVYSYIKKFSGNIEGIFTKDQQMQGLIIGWIFGFGNVKDLLASSFKVLLGAVQGFGTAIAAVAESIGFKTFAAQLAIISAGAFTTVSAIVALGVGLYGIGKAINYLSSISPKGYIARMLGIDESGKADAWMEQVERTQQQLSNMKAISPENSKLQSLNINSSDLENSMRFMKWKNKNKQDIDDIVNYAEMSIKSLEDQSKVTYGEAAKRQINERLHSLNELKNGIVALKDIGRIAASQGNSIDFSEVSKEQNYIGDRLAEAESKSLLDILVTIPTTAKDAWHNLNNEVASTGKTMDEIRNAMEAINSNNVNLRRVDNQTISAMYGINDLFKSENISMSVSSAYRDVNLFGRSSDHNVNGVGKAFDIGAGKLTEAEVKKFYDASFLERLARVARQNNIAKIIFENSKIDEVFNSSEMNAAMNLISDEAKKIITFANAKKDKNGNPIATGPNIHFSTNSIIKDTEEEMADAVGSVRNVINGLWNITTGGFVKINESMATPVKPYYDPKAIMAEYKAKTDQIERDVKFATFDFQAAIENNRKAFITNFVRSDTDKMLTEMNNMDTKFGTDEAKDIENKYTSAISSLKDKSPMVWYQNALTQAIYKQLGKTVEEQGPVLKDKTIPELEEYAKSVKGFVENPTKALIIQREEMAKSIEKQISELGNMRESELGKASTRFNNIMRTKLAGKSNFFFPNIQEDINIAMTTAAINEAKDFVRVGSNIPLIDQNVIINKLNDVAESVISGGSLEKSIEELKKFSEEYEKIYSLLERMNLNKVYNAMNSALSGAGIGIRVPEFNIQEAKQAKQAYDILVKTKELESERGGLFKFNQSVNTFKLKITNADVKRLQEIKNEMAGLNREAKGAWFSAMQGRLEMEPQALGDSFALGIEKAVSEWKNFSEIMMEEGANLVNSMTSAFETGFFDFMTMKIKTLGDLFKQIGTTIRDEILKIIAKMLALQTMKIVLGIDVNAQGQSSFTGGGLLGGLFKSFVPSLFNNKANTTGNSTPYIAGDMMSNFISGGKGNNAVVSSMLAAGGMPIGNSGVGGSFLSSGVSNLASGAIFNMGSKALTGTKLFGATGTLTKAWNGLAGKGGFLATNPWVLPAAAAISFLSQPGRLFGGRVDKTGPAQQQYANDTEMRTGYVNRRFDDAEKYKMSSKYGTIARFGFDEIGFRTWNSGGGFLGWKGPKEKHAASDSTAFYNSMKQYYQLLNTAAKEHYENTRRIDKLKEKYNLQGLQEEIKIKSNYKSQIDSIYQTALKNNDRETIDKFRDTVYETANEIADLMDQIDAEKMATSMSKRRYENYIYGGNSSFTEMQIGISEKANNMSKLTKNSREWYDAQIEYLTATKELADAAKNQAQDVKRAMNTSSISMLNNRSLAYKGSGYYGYYNATASVNPYLSDLGMTDSQKMEKYGKVSGYDTNYSLVNNSQRVQKRFWFWKYWATIPGETKNGSATITPEQYAAIQKAGGNATTISKILGVGNSSVGDKIWDSVKLTYKKLFSNNIDDVNARINELITHGNNEANVMGLKNEYKYRMANLYTNDTTKNFDNYELMFNQKSQIETTIANKFRGVTNHDNLEGADLELWDSLQELLASTNNDIAGMYESVAEQAENWINSGFVTKDIKNIVNLPLSAMETKFKEVTSLILKQQFKLDAFSSLKDLDKTDALNVLSGIKNMSGIGYTLSGTTKVNTAIGSMYTDMISTVNKTGDPWQAWYDFQIATTKTKITNLESGTEEWYSAQMELLNLQIEQQQHIKDKTQEVNDAWLDMLESIDKTLQMRIAEERNTAKGDTVFIDMRNINNEEAKNIANQIRDLIAKNDPNAATLIEALKKKLLGIMK